MAGEIICPKCSASNPKETAFCGKCGERLLGTQQVPEQADPLIGALVGDRFLVHEKLGEGGMGVVYRAEQTAIKRQVALKVLHAQLTQDESLHARFHNEAEASSRLTHPNTVTIFDFGKTDSGSLYIAMEFIKGVSLDDEIREYGAMDVSRVRNIMTQICGSLSDAHSHNIVHRDLKPENIMLCDRAGQKDVVKVLDFGIAKLLEDDGQDQRQALTKTGMVFGTPQYMSPEQIRGEQVDHRTDIYSLGVIMFQMLTGELPFTADTPMGALSKHLVDSPPKLSEINSNVSIPESVEDLVMATLAKEAGDRPQSMNELGQQLLSASSEYGPAPSAFGMSSDVMPVSSGSKMQTAATPAPGGGGQTPGKGATAGGVKAPLAKTAVQQQSGAGVVVGRPKKRKKGLIIGIVLVILLVACVALGWVLMQRDGGQPVEQQVAQPVPPPVQSPLAVNPAPQVVGQGPASQPVVTQPPANALPAAPTNPEPSSSSSSKPKPKARTDKKCSYLPVLNDDPIAKAILAKVKGQESATKECIRKGANGKTVFQFTVLRNMSVLKRVRQVSSDNGGEVTACLQKLLTGKIESGDADAAHRGTVGFEVKYDGKTIRKCRIAVQATEVKASTGAVTNRKSKRIVIPSKKTKQK